MGTGGATCATTSSTGTGGSCGTPGDWCPAATLVDDFDDNCADLGKWELGGTADCQVSEESMEVVIRPCWMPPVNAASECAYTSKALYNLMGSSVSVLLTQELISTKGGAFQYLFLTKDFTAKALAYVEASHLSCRTFITTDPMKQHDYCNVALTFPVWLRLREAGGTLYWDTSADGMAWTTEGQYTELAANDPLQLGSVRIGISAGIYQQQVPGLEARFDSLNVLP